MRCSNCRRDLPESEFTPSVFTRGSGQCRACYRERARRARSTPEGLEAAREAAREYGRRRRATPEGREAVREASRRFYAAEGRADYSRVKARLNKYGLTEEALAVMLAAQGGRCAICGTDEPGGRNSVWHVDHDHSCCPSARTCGKCIRGLLCNRCNTGLGMFRDNAEALRAAADYLEKRFYHG